MKSASTIDIMKTSNGYSIIEDEILLNKAAINVNLQQSTPPVTGIKYTRQQKNQNLVPKKFIPQQTFAIYPYINAKPAQNQPFLIIPSRSQWFNIHSVHEIERKALPEWFKSKKGLAATMNNTKFQKNEELYKKYRNYIIDLGKTKYINPTLSRKGLAGDACAIVRIHQFLEKWGLINFVHKKQSKLQSEKNGESIKSNCLEQHNHSQTKKRKDGFDKDKTLIPKIYEKDDLELLRKITKHFRPICNSCESYCGIAWFEYKDMLTKKLFPVNHQTQTCTVTSEEQFEYQLNVCFYCFIEKNYPVVLGVEDFTKKTLMEKINEINFDQKYGKKKNQEWLKVAEAVQKNKFNIAKCAEVLEMSEQEIVDILIQMPVQHLEKISRIQQETQDEEQNQKDQQQNLNVEKENNVSQNKKDEVIGDSDQDVKIFKANLEALDLEEKQIYEEFLQAWLLKMYTKLEELEEWDKAVQTKLEQNESLKKHNIAEKLRKCVKIEE